MDIHGNEAGKGGDPTLDETTIIAGPLEMAEKTAKVAMTPISNAFSLDLDTTLDFGFADSSILQPLKILTIDSEGPVPLRKIIIRKIPRISFIAFVYPSAGELNLFLYAFCSPYRVSEDMPLYDILNEFQNGQSHLAVEYKDLNKSKENLEFKDSCKMRGGEPETSRKGAAQRLFILSILDIENGPIPEFPSNEEMVGVITMEDVIEELLQEEILDETDYVNIHNSLSPMAVASQHLASPSPSGHYPIHSPASPNLAAPGPTPTLSVSSGTSNTSSPAATLEVLGEESLKDR
ncbi:Leucine carboxyl methyltransferase [Hibiscus syriacus]|uniref:Leucine carboxyl methyltransferase n=1 Tax=Hibiscus syriacus TaxID=106335 RepID=A0A6A3BCR8_HIBSY|nr:Leucine carboxyl methyltransferase [Hibiscus syriacus]